MKNLLQLTDSQLINARYIYCGRVYNIRNERQIHLFRKRLHGYGEYCVLRDGDVHYHIACDMMDFEWFRPEVVFMTTDGRGGVIDLVLPTTVMKYLKF